MRRQAELIHGGTKDHAWAIELLPEPRGFAGIFNWIHGLSRPKCMSGVGTALFETRQDARDARNGLYGFGPRRTAIRKVRVGLEVIG